MYRLRRAAARTSRNSGKPVKKRASEAKKAAGAKKALEMKKAGKGIFAPKQLSEALSAICGGKKSLPRTEVTKAIWVYIKKSKSTLGLTPSSIGFSSADLTLV